MKDLRKRLAAALFDLGEKVEPVEVIPWPFGLGVATTVALGAALWLVRDDFKMLRATVKAQFEAVNDALNARDRKLADIEAKLVALVEAVPDHGEKVEDFRRRAPLAAVLTRPSAVAGRIWDGLERFSSGFSTPSAAGLELERAVRG